MTIKNTLFNLIKQEHEILAKKLKKDMTLAINLSDSVSLDLTTSGSQIPNDVLTDVASIHRLLIKGDVYTNRILYLAPLSFENELKTPGLSTYIKQYKNQINDRILAFEKVRFTQLQISNPKENPAELVRNELKKRYKIIPANVFHPFVGEVLLDFNLKMEWLKFPQICNIALADLTRLPNNTITRYAQKYAASETLRFLQEIYHKTKNEF